MAAGNRYPANFDVLHVDDARPLMVIADGMGGGRGSAVAGRTAVDVFVAEAAAAPRIAWLGVVHGWWPAAAVIRVGTRGTDG